LRTNPRAATKTRCNFFLTSFHLHS
jgi:hypothetical protein